MDDDERTRATAREVSAARGNGWVLDIYPDRPETVNQLALAPPDVAFVSVGARPGCGLERVVEIKRAFPDLPVVVLSMCAGQGAIVRAILAGASGYIVKPAASRMLADAVTLAVLGRTALCPEAQGALLDYVRTRNSEPGFLPGSGAVAASSFEATSACDLLSWREREIMHCLAERLADKEIAERLGVARATVHAHLSQIYKKMGVHRREEARRTFLGGG